MNEQAETEAYRTLLDLAYNKTGSIPPEMLVRHVLALYDGSDWPVRRAAMEAALRRFEFARKDGLRIATPPAGREPFGIYTTRRSREQARPYRTLLACVQPLQGSCDCPDFLRSSLGLCKHLLTVVDALAARPRKMEKALSSTLHADGAWKLTWDPLRPLLGRGNWLERVRLVPGDGEKLPAKDSLRRIRKWFTPGGDHGWRIAESFEEDPRRRLRLVEDLAAFNHSAASDSLHLEPALDALLHQEKSDLVRRVADSRKRPVLRRSIASLKGTLYPYQIDAVEKFLAKGRLLLADDMGLGKTVQAIAVCQALWNMRRVRRGLIIVPASLKFQWQREWQTFGGDAPVQIIEGSPDQRRAGYDAQRRGFLVVNYEQLLRDLPVIQDWNPELVVLDEAQRIKNWATKTAGHVKQLRPPYRLVLTGTPMENRLEELASIMDWVDDQALEPKWRLVPWHSVFADGAKEVVGVRNLNTLRERLAHCMVRRRRSEILTQLPSRTDTVVPVELTPAQREEHDGLIQPIASILSRTKKRPLTQAEFLRLMSLLTAQRIIANGLAQMRFTELWPGISRLTADETFLAGLSSPKLIELREILTRIALEQERKVVVFSQWRRMLQLAHWAVRGILAEHGVKAVFFTGKESQRQRTRNLVDFHDDPQTRVLFASDAGGVGLNLQRAANCCINVEVPWNPAVVEQRIARIHRLGQSQPIDVFNLVAQDCIESRIAKLVSDKRALFEGLFDGTSDEVQFEHSGRFLSSVARIAAPVDVPPVEPDGAGDDDGAMERELEQILDASDDSGDEAKDGVDVEVPLAPSPEEIRQIFAQLKVTTTPEGGMRIEAPPAAAQSLASLFEGLANLLKG